MDGVIGVEALVHVHAALVATKKTGMKHPLLSLLFLLNSCQLLDNSFITCAAVMASKEGSHQSPFGRCDSRAMFCNVNPFLSTKSVSSLGKAAMATTTVINGIR